MEINYENALKVIDFQEKVSIIIQKRIDEFYARYGREETLNAIGTLICSNNNGIKFERKNDKPYLTWMEDIGIYYNRFEYFSLPAEYLDDEIWNEYLNNYQKVIDERVKQRKKQSIYEIKKEIAQKEEELQKLKNKLEEY